MISLFIAILLAAGQLVFYLPWQNTSQGRVSCSPNDIIILVLYCLLFIFLKKKKYIPSIFVRRVLFALIICSIMLLPLIIFHLLNGSSQFEFIGYLRNCYATSIMLFVVDYFATTRQTFTDLNILKKDIEDGILIYASCIFLKVMINIFTLIIEGTYITGILRISTSDICISILIISLYWQRIYSNTSKKITRIYLLTQTILIFPGMLVIGNRLGVMLYCVISITMFALHFQKDIRWLYRIPLFIFILVIISASCYLTSPSQRVRANIVKSINLIPPAIIETVLSKLSKHSLNINSDRSNAITTSTDTNIKKIVKTGVNLAEGSNLIRKAYWYEGIHVFREHLLFGFGQRMVVTKSDLVKLPINHTIRTSLAHNFILDIGCLLGLFGIMNYLLFMSVVIIQLFFTRLLRLKLKIFLLLQFIIYYSYGSLQPTITGAVIVNELIFCLVGLASSQIIIEKKKTESHSGPS